MASATTELALARRLPVRQRARLGWCVLVVMCAHVVVLATPSSPVVAQPTGAMSRPLQVRLLPAPGQRPLAPTHSPAAVVAEPQRPMSLAQQATPRSAPSVHDEGASAAVGHALGDASAVSSVDDTELDYLPRATLTVGPRPQAAVLIDYPYFDGEADQYIGEFDLFIDDIGGVVRVASATPDLPGILGNAVREAFLAARFSPGEVEGRPVRSRVRIEVTFDSRRLPSS